MDDRRVADERFRIDISQRLSAIETSQKLYHAELKSIIENIFEETAELKRQVHTLHYTIYGGPAPDNIGLLERLRALLTKASIYLTIAFTTITLIFKLFGSDLAKLIMHIMQKQS